MERTKANEIENLALRCHDLSDFVLRLRNLQERVAEYANPEWEEQSEDLIESAMKLRRKLIERRQELEGVVVR